MIVAVHKVIQSPDGLHEAADVFFKWQSFEETHATTLLIMSVITIKAFQMLGLNNLMQMVRLVFLLTV
jgi:hypothetical protein